LFVKKQGKTHVAHCMACFSPIDVYAKLQNEHALQKKEEMKNNNIKL
jgi:hypothetical protein